MILADGHILNNDFALKDCLFGAVNLTKIAYPDKNFYSGYGTGFDSLSFFTFLGFNSGKNVGFLE